MHRTLLVILTLLCCAVARGADSPPQMVIEKLDGPVTQTEIDSFKQFMAQLPLPVSNNHNGMVYGSGGGAVEALGDVYQITHDPQILNRMLQFTDAMLAARNDAQSGRIIWTGKRELCWPNKPADSAEAKYSGTENGDVPISSMPHS